MSEIKALTVPKWGMAMEEGTLVNWLVKEGEMVRAGDEIAEIESSKIVNVMETHIAGTVHRLVATEDETLPVGGLLAVIGDKDASKEEVDQFIASFEATPQAVSNREQGAPAEQETTVEPTAAASAQTLPSAQPKPPAGGVPESLKSGSDDSGVAATPHVRRLARQYGINLNNIHASSGRHDRVTVADIEKAVTEAGGSIKTRSEARSVQRPASLEDDSSVPATPLARRIAKQKGINLHDCRASGSRGRVCKADVEALDSERHGRAAPTALEVPPAEAPAAVETIPMSAMRQTIGRRLQRSKIDIPHYRLVAEADIDALLALRGELNDSLDEANVSVNDLLIKCCATALMQVPGCNVQLHGDTIHRFNDADIAVAVALEAGLITPVIRSVNRKGVAAVSNEARELITRAKAGTLKPDEFEGGTFTVSNLGMFGIRQFDAIINPPQCAILAVGAGEERVIVADGEPDVATMLTLSLSLDHRVIDGALGARFMQALVRIIEHPGLMSA